MVAIILTARAAGSGGGWREAGHFRRAHRNPVFQTACRSSGNQLRAAIAAFLGGVSKAPPLIAWRTCPLDARVSAATHSQALPIRSSAPTPDRPSGKEPTGLKLSVAAAALARP